MVSYQVLTQLAFEVAESKGAEYEGARPENAREVISIVSAEWNDNKEMYLQMTEEQAREQLEDLISVS